MRPGFAGREAGSSNLSSEIFSLPSGFVRHWAPHWDTQGASEVLGSRLAECSSGLRWNSWQGIAAGLRWRARLERVPGAARLTLQVSENPIDDSGIGDDGDNLHLCAADTEKRIHLCCGTACLAARLYMP